MFELLSSNLPGIITAFIAAIPALLLAINTIVSSHARKPIVLIDPALNLLGITYTALDEQELKAFRRLKFKRWSLIFAFLLTTYVAIFLFIYRFITHAYINYLYIGIAVILIFSVTFIYSSIKGYNFISNIQYSVFHLTSPNIEFALFRKAEMTIQADYPYLIAKCYQALKSVKIQTVRINSVDNSHNSSLSSSKMAISLIQTEKTDSHKIIIEPVITNKATHDYEETSKCIESLIERLLDIPSNYTAPLNLRIKIEP
jgi:hypothetical protein